jgi:hypothetical protein
MIALLLLIASSSEPASQPASASVTPAIVGPRIEHTAAPRAPRPIPFQADVRVEVGYKAVAGMMPSQQAFGLPQAVSLGTFGLTWTPLTIARFSFGPGARWEPSITNGRIGNASFSQWQHRLLLSVDARYRPVSFLELYARGAGGFTLSTLRFDGTIPAGGNGVLATADAGGGVSFLLGPHRRIEARRVRVWLSLEGGYTFTGRANANLSPELSDGRSSGAVNVALPVLQGPYFKTALALAF